MFGFLSGWQDSNLRPPGPKPGAMTGLRYTPSGLLNYSSSKPVCCNCGCKYSIKFNIPKHYKVFLFKHS